MRDTRNVDRCADKGIMAMIGRQTAVAQNGADRHDLHGRFAFAAWLGVHASGWPTWAQN